MPIYEYACTACGRHIDVVHGIHAPGPTVCDVCGGAMKKALTAPAIHFKGSGWAKKDARAAATPVTPAAAAKEAAPGVGESAPAGDAASGREGSSGGDATAPTPATPAPAAAPAATAPAATTPGT